MAKQIQFIFVLSMALLVHSITLRVTADHGTATYYTPPYVPSACDGFTNEGDMIAAASQEIWDNGGACGRKYIVKCTGATNQGDPHPCKGDNIVEVTIVDFCPPGSCQGTIDLSEQAFSSISNTDAGKIYVDYNRA